MKIDPLLQVFIDRQVKIAINSFAKNIRPTALKNIILLIFTGLGLAESDEDDDEILVRSKELIELESTEAEITEMNLSSFVRSYVELNRQTRMTKSLRLIVDDVIATNKKHSSVTDIDEETVLLKLAGNSCVHLFPTCFWPKGGDYIWCAYPQLVLYYAMGQGLAFSKRKTKMDGVLRNIATEFCSSVAAPRSLAGQLAKTYASICLEVDGKAIAELDAEGELTWRASQVLMLEYESQPQGARRAGPVSTPGVSICYVNNGFCFFCKSNSGGIRALPQQQKRDLDLAIGSPRGWSDGVQVIGICSLHAAPRNRASRPVDLNRD